MLNGLHWNPESLHALSSSPLMKFVTLAASESDSSDSLALLVCSLLHPLFLQAKTAANQEDNPNWWQAMNSPFHEEFWEAACVEIETLEHMNAWDVVSRSDEMNVLPSAWAFKMKWLPDGKIKKFKARFCARGDKQIEGVDYFESYAPVAQWTTVCLMLVLECLLGLVSKQGDVTCAFFHAHLEEGENVYLEMPQGFKQYNSNKRPKVLKLKRTLYGLRQSPRAFWQFLTEKIGSLQTQAV